MKRALGVVLVLGVLMTRPHADGTDGHANSRATSPSDSSESNCPATPSYAKCTSVAPFTLGLWGGVTISTSFCQSNDCYAFYNSLSATTMAKCLSGYKVGSVAMTNASGMKNCFTTGGVLQAPATTTAAPATSASPQAPPSSPTTGTTTSDSPVTTKAPSPSAPTTAGGDTSRNADAIAAAATDTKPRTTTAGQSSSPNNVVSEEILSEVVESGSGRGRKVVKIVKKKKITTGSGAVVEVEVDDSSSSGSSANSTVRGAKRSAVSNKGGGSQSDALPGAIGHDGQRETTTSVWVIATGIVAGVLFALCLFLLYRKRHAKRIEAKKLDDPNQDEYIATLDSARSNTELVAALWTNASLPASRCAFWDDEVVNAVRIPYEKLEFGALLSRGGYGEVHRGQYRDQPVAIKSLLAERRKDMRQIEKFITEVKLMAVLEHERIVRFVGVAWDSLHELCVVSEFMAGGDLRSLLAHYQANERQYPRGFTADKLKIAMHVAHGLTYMHSLQPPVLHRDLKSRNVLLDAELNAKLTDFGISRERADSTMTVGVGSSLWMAPEVMTGGRYDEKADVFSFGVLLSELDVQTLPYAHALEPGTGRKLPDTVVVQMMTTGRISVQFSSETESLLAQLGRQCVALDPDDRPTAAEVQHRIHQLWRNPEDSL